MIFYLSNGVIRNRIAHFFHTPNMTRNKQTFINYRASFSTIDYTYEALKSKTKNTVKMAG